VETAKGLVDKITKATLATSSLVTTVEVFGDFYQANQKVEQSLSKISKLQWEYNNALEEGSENAKQLAE
jgi:hypothetical protein